MPTPSGARVAAHQALDRRSERSSTGASASPRAVIPGTAQPPSPTQALDAAVQVRLQADETLRARLEMAGLRAVTNDGATANLCLLIAMLHHLGVPPHLANQQAWALAAGLAGGPQALGQQLDEGEGLHVDRNVVQPLAELVFGPGHLPPLRIMTPGPDGVPLIFDPLSEDGDDPAMTPAIPDDALVIVESHRHYEALANMSGLPLSAALARLAVPEVSPAETTLRERMVGIGLQLLPANELLLRPASATLLITLDGDGEPVVRDAAHPAQLGEADLSTVPHDAGMFVQWPGDRLEAVANTSGRPWSQVLMRLQIGPGQPEADRSSEWLRHDIDSVRSVDVAVPVDRQRQVHGYRLGAQVRLSSPEADRQTAPLAKADALAGAQSEVDAFWDALASRGAEQVGHDKSEAGDDIHTMGVIPDRPDAAMQVGRLQVRQERIMGLTFWGSTGTQATVDYDHPWARPALEHRTARSTLEKVEDLNIFDKLLGSDTREFSALDASNLARTLLHLRREGIDWMSMREMPANQRAKILRGKDLGSAVQASITRLIAPGHKRIIQASEKTLAKLTHPDDRADFDEFISRGLTVSQKMDTGMLSNLMVHLRASDPDRGIRGFSLRPPEERSRYIREAVARKQLRSGTNAAFDRFINNESSVAVKYVRHRLGHPDDLDRYDEFAWRSRDSRARDDLNKFATLLTVLRRQVDRGWAGFNALSPPERDTQIASMIQARSVAEGIRSVMDRVLNPPRHFQQKDFLKLAEADRAAYLQAMPHMQGREGKHDVAAFLLDLSRHRPGLGLAGFTATAADEQAAYFQEAITHKRLAPAVETTIRRLLLRIKAAGPSKV